MKKTSIIFLIIIFIIVLLVLIGTRKCSVVGSSMAPQYITGDEVLVENFLPKIGMLYRGQVIVFPDPRDSLRKVYIKRVIGLPGETVKTDIDRVIITKKNGTFEEYKTGTPIGGMSSSDVAREMYLGPEDYFVMGDNRNGSTDSRHWGSIQAHEITGSVIYKF